MDETRNARRGADRGSAGGSRAPATPHPETADQADGFSGDAPARERATGDPAHTLPAPEESVEQLQAAEARAAEFEDRWLRAAADFDNYRRRVAREREAAVAAAGDQALLSVVRALDDLQRAIEAGEAEGTTADALRAGIQLVEQKLATELAGQGVEAIDPLGEEFDPARHEAVARDPSGPAGRVTRVLARGYARGGRILRPAQVIVGAGAAAA